MLGVGSNGGLLSLQISEDFFNGVSHAFCPKGRADLLATPLPPTPPPAIGDRRSAPICDLQSAIGSNLWPAIGDRRSA